MVFGEDAALGFNLVDYTPLTRSALVQLDRWIAEGVEPPPSAHPRIDDGSAVSRADVLRRFAERGLATLDPDRLSRIRTIDLGPTAAHGVGQYPSREGAEYAGFVSDVNDDWNETAGIRLPDLTSPVASHSGWNPRHPDNGAPDLMAHFVGFTTFWPPDDIQRRYGDREAYQRRVEADAAQLAAERRILPEDQPLVVQNALARYDSAMTNQ